MPRYIPSQADAHRNRSLPSTTKSTRIQRVRMCQNKHHDDRRVCDGGRSVARRVSLEPTGEVSRCSTSGRGTPNERRDGDEAQGLEDQRHAKTTERLQPPLPHLQHHHRQRLRSPRSSPALSDSMEPMKLQRIQKVGVRWSTNHLAMDSSVRTIQESFKGCINSHPNAEPRTQKIPTYKIPNVMDRLVFAQIPGARRRGVGILACVPRRGDSQTGLVRGNRG